MLQLDGNVSFTSDSSISSQHQINVHITNRGQHVSPTVMFGPKNIHTIKRSNKLAQTLHLPKLCNINPQSVYNKQDEFITFVEQMDCDVIFISESWERSNFTLDEVMRPLKTIQLFQMYTKGREGEGGQH